MIDVQIYIYICIYIYIPGTHLSFVSPPQEAFSQSKQASFGLQVYTVTIYIYIICMLFHNFFGEPWPDIFGRFPDPFLSGIEIQETTKQHQFNTLKLT